MMSSIVLNKPILLTALLMYISNRKTDDNFIEKSKMQNRRYY